MRARITALAGLAVVALAAGCGGGGGGGGDRLTQEEFIQQADAICADSDQQIGALGEPQTMEELATLAPQAFAISGQTLDALRELNPPEGLAAQYTRALDLLQQQQDLEQEFVDAAESGDQAQVDAVIAKGEPLETEADGIAKELGLTECGSD